MQIREGYYKSTPFLKISGVPYFDVEKTFDCGQCFRFDRVADSEHTAEFSGVAFGRLVAFAADGDTLYVYNSDEKDFNSIWRRYLALDTDYEQIDRDVISHCSGTVMDRAMEYGKGIRILKQDAYEAVISFIISQNNNIPRIKKIIEALSGSCGQGIPVPSGMEKHLSGVSSLCTFPDCDALLSLGESGLYELKTGFRAKYIYDAAKRIADGSLDLKKLESTESTDDCIAQLCEVKGIGLKVASCAALFGLARYDAFPIDVWMKRVAEKYFSDEAESFSGARFGQYAGIAQQYLFYYERYCGGDDDAQK